jgi:hypothetical protein
MAAEKNLAVTVYVIAPRLGSSMLIHARVLFLLVDLEAALIYTSTSKL